MAESLLGLLSFLLGLNHGALMLSFLSCRQSSRLEVSPNLFSSEPYEAWSPNFWLLIKDWVLQVISNNNNVVCGSWNCIRAHCLWSAQNGCIPMQKLSTPVGELRPNECYSYRCRIMCMPPFPFPKMISGSARHPFLSGVKHSHFEFIRYTATSLSIQMTLKHFTCFCSLSTKPRINTKSSA